MNVVDNDPRPHDPARIDPAEYGRPEMRAALAVRDMTRVYRLLQKIGYSQQRIASLTGQSQPEVSAIVHGRKVMAYDLLARIADGLGIPRGYVGLSYAGQEGCHRCAVTRADADESEEDDPVRRRDFIGAAAAVAMGGNLPGLNRWLPQAGTAPASVPARVGIADISGIRTTSVQLEQLLLRLGGGAALDAVTGYLRWAAGLLASRCDEATGRQLRAALADLYGVAGWSLHDAGQHREASRYFMQALVLARDIEDRGLTAVVLVCMGRVSLHQEHADDALRMFQLAQLAAQDIGAHAELARLHGHEAQAYALLGQPRRMTEALARAEHEYGRVVAGREPASLHSAALWDATFAGDAAANEANAQWALARVGDSALTTRAGERVAHISTQLLASSAGDRPAISQARDRIRLAGGLLCSGDRAAGIAAGHAAVEHAQSMRSGRQIDMLGHVARSAATWPNDPDAIHLRRRITALRSV
jgi:transcriptional regulator with XRE-family HTH domain